MAEKKAKSVGPAAAKKSKASAPPASAPKAEIKKTSPRRGAAKGKPGA